MVIRFTCPQGHKLSCPDDRAGRRGKCPECETLFQVPTPPKDGEKSDVLKAEEIIEFYCPNEHYLQSPARLEGKRGQCPQCGAKFRVPSRDDVEEEGTADAEGLEDVEDVEEIEEVTTDGDDLEEIEEVAEVGGGEELDLPPQQEPPVVGPPPEFEYVEGEPPVVPVGPPGDMHPMALLFERIWDNSDPEAVVELQFSDGQKIAPQHYAHDLSRGQQAVFGIRDRDSTYTVTVVPWESVTRVTVRGLTELPNTMFDAVEQ